MNEFRINDTAIRTMYRFNAEKCVPLKIFAYFAFGATIAGILIKWWF